MASCVASSAYVHPVVFSTVRPCGGETPEKISKSQRRRQRERHAAVKRSQLMSVELRNCLSGVLTSKQSAGICKPPVGNWSVTEQLGSVSLRLSALEFKLDLLLGNVGLWAPPEPEITTGVSAEILAGECQAVRKIQRWYRKLARDATVTRKLQPHLNEYRSDDVHDFGMLDGHPEKISHESLGTMLLHGGGHNPDFKTSPMQNLELEPSRTYCSDCMKRSTRCSCELPQLFSSNCCVCDKPVSECGCSMEEREIVYEINSVGTAESCAICQTIENQGQLVECDGKGCGRLFHSETCGSEVKAPDQGGAWLCTECCKNDNVLTDSDSCDDESTGVEPLELEVYQEAMTLLQKERARRQQVLELARENVEDIVTEAEQHPEDMRLVAKSKEALAEMRAAQAKVEEMLGDDFVKSFLHSRGYRL